MTGENYFNLNRFGLLVKNDLLINKQAILTFIAAIAGVLFLFGLISPVGAEISNFHPTAYFLLLFVGGFWTTSLAFKDLHDKQKSYAFLTLPCSNFEKFLSILLLTSIGYVLGISVFYYLLSLIVVAINSLLFGYPQYIFNPFQHDILLNIRSFLIFQAVFFLGAIYFKSRVMTKTILYLSCLAIIFTLFTFLIIMMLLGPFGISLLHLFTSIFSSIFWLILAPCCWVIAYIRLCEAEV